MRAPSDEAGQLQRPLPNTMLRIVASGERGDPPSEAAQAQPLLYGPGLSCGMLSGKQERILWTRKS
jgi:hypothetical protein